ncbi:MAG: Rpn family recombination-promoting nuclease/putative transposase [Clostridiales bacterium]|nr:Rpn family recombination-promoting nuclease/putative transposase [Candidatus Blautia equi]
MRKRKTLQELTIKDNFMFSAVMIDEENCRRLLELVLRIPIANVTVSKEKSMIYNPQFHGVRLDVYAKDKANTHYNVEMQVRREHVEKRSRYYHSQMDMELLLSGSSYEDLPDTYVIFICDYDPFGLGKYQYTVKKSFEETQESSYSDGIHSIFLSTEGTNRDEVPQELVKFLKFVKSDLAESNSDFQDDFVSHLQKTVAQIKSSRELGAKYMLFEELLKEERAEGQMDGLIFILKTRFSAGEDFLDRVRSYEKKEKLDELFLTAIQAETLQEFEEKLK